MYVEIYCILKYSAVKCVHREEVFENILFLLAQLTKDNSVCKSVAKQLVKSVIWWK